MVLPQNATVEATPNFIANLEASHKFFTLQDPDSADARLAKLKTDLREMIQILSWSPGSGRSARFFSAKSAQVQLKANAVMALAEQSGLPNLREYVIGQHIVLYTHSTVKVVLLAIKHQRQLVFTSA
jgi:hypothetical protein